MENNALVLEVSRQENSLVMSVFARSEYASTLRHYSEVNFYPEEINKLCREMAALLNSSDKSDSFGSELSNSLKKNGQLLWDQLLSKAVKDKLQNAHTQDLILSIDEQLIYIPWELLYTGDNFLCLKFNLGRVVSTKTKSFAPCYRGRPKVSRMLILANPTGDLKDTYAEGINIRDQLADRAKLIRVDFKSTSIGTLFVKKNLRDYDIVHFAGHCEYDHADPGSSGWVLSDGKFSARDICALGETLSMPSVVFSNACQSAQEEMYSLAAAFLFAGVRHYIGTIRKIEDPESLKFARYFYGFLISGKTVGESLRLARLKLVSEQKKGYIFWAGYILYGDPDFVLFGPAKIRRRTDTGINIARQGKKFIPISISIGIFLISLWAYLWLPTLNPGTYFLFRRSEKLFLSGDNAEVISLGRRIVQSDPFFLAEYSLLANTYQRLGDKDNALKYCFEYIRYSDKRNDLKNLACAYAGTGWMYYLFGDYGKAKDFYDRALVLSRQNQDKLNEADTLGKLAVWFMDKDDNDKALELLTKSAEINRERRQIYKHRYNLACDYFNLGLVFTNKDDFSTASEFYDKSFKIFSELKMTHELSDYYFNMGEICGFRKEYQKVVDFYTKGLEIDLRLGNKFNLAGDYNMFGELYMEMDNLAQAEKYFNQSIEIALETSTYPYLAQAYYDLTHLFIKKKDKIKARQYLSQATEIYASIDPEKCRKIKEEFPELSAK